jgi:cytochrome c553
MWRVALVMGSALLIAIPLTMSSVAQTAANRELTFSKDVAPIVFEHCVSCHRPGEVGPFSMFPFSAIRPWARSIKQSVVARRMPPWFAVSAAGDFLHNKELKESDIRTIAAWVDAGAPEGNPKDIPAPPAVADEWRIGAPDLIVTMAEPFRLPATGLISNVTVATEYVFTRDTWVEAIEIRPGNRQVVHQALAVLGTGGLANGLYLYSAGLEPMQLRDGYAKFIPQGSRIFLRMHYITIGRETSDQTRVGLRFASKPVHTEVRVGIAEKDSFVPPALPESHQSASTFPLNGKARIHAWRSHMPTRGRQATATLVSPDRSRRVLFSINGWTDYWQYYYALAKPIEVPRGAFVEYLTDYDRNSNSGEEAHGLFFDWTEVNDANKDDSEPIFFKTP